MTWSNRYPKTDEPALEQISEYVDTPLWGESCGFMEACYAPQSKIEYSVCASAPGWNVKYRVHGRALCTLYPHEEFFTCLVCIGNKELLNAEAILTTCCPYVRELFQNAHPMNGTRWLMIDITSQEIMEDAKRLIDTRVQRKQK
jgi:hypothetical protein